MHEGFTGPADDIAAIRALHDRYADAVNRGDAADWGALWAEDARWDLMGMKVEGRAAIVELWKGAMAGFAFVAFFSQTASIRVMGEQGEGRIWTHEILVEGDSERRPLGRYDDVYARRAGQWLYLERKFSLRRP